MENYRLIKQIGRGGTSKVYLGADRFQGEKYAIKVYEDREDFFRARRELSLIQELDFPAIPKVYKTVCEKDVRYIVMEYVPGETLKDIIREEKRLCEKQVIRWGMELCDVLSYLHGRSPSVIYRDLKPGNIIISPLSHIKLIDFGAAIRCRRRIADEKTGESVEPLGTLGYAAPEQFGRGTNIDTRADIFAFGVTLYQMLTGVNPCRMPYRFEPLRKYNKKISREMEEIVNRCVQRERGKRYRFCEEIKSDLEHIHSGGTAHRKLYITRSEIVY